ncbi:MAG: nucleotidyl transferase AbiEii/AbiGii toxin family protein [Deltaproteobacteria bacterium]|nr:nucleotidyl transferase AbiEii/AbiGii toxin family protein [Deltaproteobacteria bacterium]
MKFGAEEIQQHADALGFRPDTLEKVFRLLSLLETLRSNAFLRPRVALKGGTALNLFLFDMPRLSVDIDLNYVGSGDRDTMLADKPKVEHAIVAVCSREGLTVKRMPSEHAGGKWRLSFVNTAGSSDKLEVDLNFMLRVPLWPVTTLDSKPLGPAVAREIAVVDRHELAAGKLAALVARNASRDIFDARELLRRTDLDRDKLRLAFVVYGGLNRKDWRTVRLDDVAAEPAELKREVVPMLRAEVRPKDAEIVTWAEALVRETRALMSAVLPLETHELEFVERLNGTGDIAPELLTSDPAMQATIREQPGLRWKALNVKKRLGSGGDDQEPPA